MIKGCIDCKHHKSRFNGDKMVRQCLKGLNVIMFQWWIANENKIRGEHQFTELSCFEDDEFSKLLKKTLIEQDELLKKMKELEKN